MRLDQFLQKTLGVSRQTARSILKSKQVSVNGEMVKQAKHQLDLAVDRVFYGQESLVYQEFYYWMLNKPKGYVSSHIHDGGIPIYQLLEDFSHVEMHCAGRLDVDTTGLVLITNNGQWSHRVAHPSQACFKRYRVMTQMPLSDDAIAALEKGVTLGNGETTLPATVVRLADNEIELSICEGKFHQVKRMLKAVGNEVIDLHRLQIGAITLGDLAEGDYRALTEAEIEEFA
ncbi:pseudouridine synthase [Wohlfahrtiimonas chitiniclastica]|uniref:pseudouridine synthase n=1 Tax=Wohlfahrtiimonas chitiniclastica TaxID=400946 RepID=UPI0007B69AF2|nr:pseudouridine synthase [Wohlfahrtiimonas chitiniclastica]KZX37571.1 16S rRNA pseudouridine(516) synthase [Wohlfahrtiimonas chitiniclastica]